MWLQKLTYMAHGWNLAINQEPLISQDPEAWDNGPVFRAIWDHIKQYGYGREHSELIDPGAQAPFRADLTASERQVIEHVWLKYRHLGARELSDLTHQPGTPWSNAYLRARNATLSNTEIREHFSALAQAGRERRQHQTV